MLVTGPGLSVFLILSKQNHWFVHRDCQLMCQLWQLKDWHLYLSLYSVLQEKSAIKTCLISKERQRWYFTVFCFYFQTSNHRKNWSCSSWGKSLYFPCDCSPRMGSFCIISKVFVFSAAEYGQKSSSPIASHQFEGLEHIAGKLRLNLSPTAGGFLPKEIVSYTKLKYYRHWW